MDSFEQSIKEPNPFWKKVKKGANKTLTFFGVPANTILVFFGVLLLLLTLIPMVSILITTLAVKDPILGNITEFTWNNYYETFAGGNSKGYFWIPLLRSLGVSVLACFFALLFGGITAYLITRTDLKFKKFISAVFIFPYVMPQWTLALFWRNIFVNTEIDWALAYMGEFQALTGIAVPDWMVFGMFPIAFVLGLHYAPFAYILLGGVLRNMDSNLEEAAVILNIPKWKVFFKVTIPMLKPAILSTILLVFSSALSSYAVPVTLGNPTNYYLISTQMEWMINGHDAGIAGMGNVMSVVLIVIGVLILLINQFQTGSRKQFTTVSGKSGQAETKTLGKVGKWVVSIILLIIVVFFCIGPMVSFAIESVLPNQGDYSSGFTSKWWLTNDKSLRNGNNGLLYSSDVWIALRNSIILSVVCALLAGTIGLLIGYAVAKNRKSKWAQFVNGLAFLPYLLPSISMSVIFFHLGADLAGFGITFLTKSWWVLAILVGTIKYIPFASRSSLNAMLQLSNEIEEAAVIQNVSWWKRMLHVIFPIQKSSFLSGYLLPFISCMRELSLFIFIVPASGVLTRQLFLFEQDGIPALENGANLMLVIVILIFNWLVNKITGASLDKGIGG